MAQKMPIGEFVAGLKAALDRKDGYIMGAKGQAPKKWATNSWWYTQYSGSQRTKALYWREHAQRVWDCNGMAEGLYQDWSGVDINTKARYNYSGWCDPKGTGKIPEKYRVPGAAVFIHSSSSGYITHVGYLVEPANTGNPSGDWWVIEARGVMYGVVKTKLSERGWNRWGLMTKYFDYDQTDVPEAPSDDELEFGHRTLKKGCKGYDVKALQQALIDLGYSCGSYGADGDFGSKTKDAVMAFQHDHGLEVDGIAGEKTFAKLNDLMPDNGDPEEVKYLKIRVTGGTVNVRTQPSTAGKIVKVAKKGETYPATGETENGWYQIIVNDENVWISGKYAEVAE